MGSRSSQFPNARQIAQGAQICHRLSFSPDLIFREQAELHQAAVVLRMAAWAAASREARGADELEVTQEVIEELTRGICYE